MDGNGHDAEDAPRHIRFDGSPFGERFVIIGSAMQLIVLILFSLLTEFEEVENSKNTAANPLATPSNAQQSLDKYYVFFQDMQLMIFVGFGFVIAWLKKCGYTAVGMNLYLGAFVLQWGALAIIVARHVADQDKYSWPAKADISMFVNADIAAAAVAVTFGALVGKVSPVQLVLVAVLEVAV
jgi:ammonium transporter Rh